MQKECDGPVPSTSKDISVDPVPTETECPPTLARTSQEQKGVDTLAGPQRSPVSTPPKDPSSRQEVTTQAAGIRDGDDKWVDETAKEESPTPSKVTLKYLSL